MSGFEYEWLVRAVCHDDSVRARSESERERRKVWLAAGPSEDVFEPSFLELYRDHFAEMVRLAVVLTGLEASAEDLVHMCSFGCTLGGGRSSSRAHISVVQW